MKQIPKKGFTFVELIVVVVILGVLGTIGIVSYTTYLGGARDSNRITQISDIKSGLEIYAVNKLLPTPENSVNILANGNTIAYQGYAGEKVLNQIGYQDGGTDPLDNTYFTYYTTADQKSFQLMALLEEQDVVTYNFVPQTYASDIDYSERIPTVTGKKLGVLVENITNTPVQEISAVQNSGLELSTAGTGYKAYYSDEKVLRDDLNQIIPNQSCKRILELGNSIGSGIYKINPTGTSTIQVYCDMETDGGGWTFVAHVNNDSNESTFFESNIGTYTPTREDNDTTYSIVSDNLNHTEMMILVGEKGATIQSAPSATEAESNNKLVIMKYEQDNPMFYSGPIGAACGDNYSYKTTINGAYTGVGRASGCSGGSFMYYRDTTVTDGQGYIILFHNGSPYGTYLGAMVYGVNQGWNQDSWIYVR